MKVKELIEELSKLDQEKDIALVDSQTFNEFDIRRVEESDEGDWYVID